MKIFFLCMCLLFVIALLCKIKIQVEYHEKLSVIIKYMFFKIDIVKFMEKKKDKPEKKEKKKKTPEEKSKKLITSFSQVKVILEKAFLGMKKSITFETIDLQVALGVEDAKDTAMFCGYIYAGYYALEPFLFGQFKVLQKNIMVTPRFNEQVFEASVSIHLSARVINLLIAAMGVFMAYFKVTKEARKNTAKQDTPDVAMAGQKGS